MRVAPSLLSADFADLRGEIAAMERAGADQFHLDVMDAHFVPNLTFGPPVVAAARRCTGLPLDVHLMMTRPDLYLEAFADAGADALTIHLECEADLPRTLDRIGALGLQRGLSLNPDTPLEGLLPLLAAVDIVLVMSVPAGFGGQSFRPEALDKLRTLAARRAAGAGDFELAVDGGVNAATAPACREAGADVLVSGSYLFGSPDRAAAVAGLRGEAPRKP